MLKAAELEDSSEEAILEEINQLHKKFDDAMDDDFNTADAVTAIFEMVKIANTKINSSSSVELIQKVLDKIIMLCDILGIKSEKVEELLDQEIENLIEERQAARKNKDFKRADEIRNLLLEKGIILEDTREGVKWKRA